MENLWNATATALLTPSLAPSLSPTSRDDAVSSLNDAQDKALSILPIISGLLSAYGSANIIYMVYQSKQRNCYKRILLGLSCSDFLSSSVLWLQAFLLPSDTSDRVWAIGTDATCTAMGFFQQLSLANVWYNGMLSFYFLLTIRYCVATHRFESWMHGLSIGIPLLTAFLGVAMGLYDELRVGHFCYFTGPPMATYIAGVVGGLPALFFFCAIPINNILVYAHVRRTARNTSDKSAVASSACELPFGDQSATTTSTMPSSLISQETTSTMSTSIRDQRELALQQQRKQLQQARENERVQAVAFQAFLYVAAYVVSYLPTTILRIYAAANSLNSNDEAQLFPLLVLQAIFWPLQGLFNYIIYCRSPPYLRESVAEGT